MTLYFFIFNFKMKNIFEDLLNKIELKIIYDSIFHILHLHNNIFNFFGEKIHLYNAFICKDFVILK